MGAIEFVAATAHADAHVGVNVSDVLPVALRQLDDFGTDLDGLAATLLPRPAAALANLERDLIARPPRVPIALEGLTAEEQDSCLFVDGLLLATPFRWTALRRE